MRPTWRIFLLIIIFMLSLMAASYLYTAHLQKSENPKIEDIKVSVCRLLGEVSKQYVGDPMMLIEIRSVVAAGFATIATANNYWRKQITVSQISGKELF